MTEPAAQTAPQPEEPTKAPDEVFPRRFGKYTLLRQLATGGMAELYLALHRSIAGFERLVVIKRILPKMAQDQGFITMLLQEARIAATFSHPNVVTLFDVGQVEGTYFIAMEHIHGEDLRSVVRAMKPKGQVEFPLAHALTIARDVAAGLAYAHEKKDLHGNPLNVVHRDISPQNVLVTFSGDVKVVDFGIAKASLSRPVDETAPRKTVAGDVLVPESGDVSNPSSGERDAFGTAAGQLKGKIPYMSPEQARGEELDARSDVFSLGIILFELCTGRRLFRGANETETLKLITDGLYPRAAEINPRISPRLEAIIARTLEPRADDRYQSARDLQADLESVIHEEHIAGSSVALGKWMQMLFEERLEAQREALAQGKQLADVLGTDDPEGTDEPMGPQTHERFRPSFVPALVPTPSEPPAAIAPPRKTPWLALGLLATVVASYGAVTMRSHQRAEAVRRAEVESLSGSITIHSVPEGATVWLNDTPTPFRTPYTLTRLATGATARYHLRLAAEGYAPATEEVALAHPHAAETVTAVLARAHAGGLAVLQVATAPPGAQVLVDGTAIPGVTPMTIPGLSPGVEHSVLVRATEHLDESFNFVGAAGQVENRALVLRDRPLEPNQGYLTVETEPRDAMVTIDGAAVPTGSPYRVRVTAGRSVQVVVSAAGYTPESYIAHPTAGQTVALAPVHLAHEHHRARELPHAEAPVDHTPGRLTIGAMPWCTVAIDGVAHGQTPVVGVPLAPGSHTVVCTNPGRGSQTRHVSLGPGQDLRVRIEFP